MDAGYRRMFNSVINAIYEGGMKSEFDYNIVEHIMRYEFYKFQPAHYLGYSFLDAFDDKTKNAIATVMYAFIFGKLKSKDLDNIDWYKEPRFNNYNLFNEQTKYSYIDYSFVMEVIYRSKAFPFSDDREFNRHKFVMEKRHVDLKNGLIKPPVFFDGSSYGVAEVKNHLRHRLSGKKPKVKGKTLFLSIYYHGLDDNMHMINSANADDFYESFSKGYLINWNYGNKFDNVEHPMRYFLPGKALERKFFEDGRYYPYYLHVSIAGFCSSNYKAKFSYEAQEKLYSRYDIICFNLFELPIKKEIIEDFMSYILVFQRKHPEIYIKDVSGRGLYAYRKYSFYEKLKKSEIDV